MFTIWAKSRDKEQRQRATKEQRNKGTQKTAVAPDKKDEKNNPKYLHIKIIVYLCGMKTKNRKNIKRKERNDLVPMLAIIATGVTCAGILLGGATLAVAGATMYLIPIYVAILGNKYF